MLAVSLRARQWLLQPKLHTVIMTNVRTEIENVSCAVGSRCGECCYKGKYYVFTAEIQKKNHEVDSGNY